MSRLTEKKPETGHRVRKISDVKHEVYHLSSQYLGFVTKTPEGWTLEDGTKFNQEQDAIRQMYEDASIKWQGRTPASPKSKVKIIDVKPEQTIIRVAGFTLDMRTFAYKGFKWFKVVTTQKEVTLYGAKTKAERENETWTEIGSTDVADSQ